MKTSSNTKVIPQRWLAGVSGLLAGAALIALTAVGEARAQKEIEIGIGTQNTTSNTVTGGIVIKELGLLEKYLPRTGQYKDVKFKIDWQNFTSGPPITNGMMANKIHIGMMGDYPLLVNGATGQQTRNETLLVAIIAYNQYGGGNGMVVHKDSPYYELADLKGKNVSVPFGSAAHGMLIQAMQSRGWPENFWNLASQSPEVGTTNLQESIVFITFLGSFFPILLNTVHGVTTLDPVLVRAARCLGASEAQLFRAVILPGVMPQIFTGLAVGIGVAWVSLIAAEMISGQFGVGYFTWEAYSLVNYAEIALGMITIGMLGLVCSGVIRVVGNLVMPWRAHSAGGNR